MIQEELEKKVREYLNNNNKQYYEDSIKYSGLREDMKQIDGSVKTMHVVTYMVSINNQEYDSDVFYYAFFDDENHKFDYIMGPQSYEKIG